MCQNILENWYYKNLQRYIIKVLDFVQPNIGRVKLKEMYLN